MGYVIESRVVNLNGVKCLRARSNLQLFPQGDCELSGLDCMEFDIYIGGHDVEGVV